MPRGNRMGPTGMGPMTGRAAGFCTGADVPGYADPAKRRGVGHLNCQPLGGGRRWRRGFRDFGFPGWMRARGAGGSYGYPAPYQPPDPTVERQALKNQAEALQSELDVINKRLAEIEPESAGN